MTSAVHFHFLRKQTGTTMSTLFCVFCFVIVFQVVHTPPTFANPFEALPTDHWSYDMVAGLAEKGLFQHRTNQHLESELQFTMLELSVWIGDALELIETPRKQEKGGEIIGFTDDQDHARWISFYDMIHSYNSWAEVSLTEEDATDLLQLVVFTRDYLIALGFHLPPDVMQSELLPGLPENGSFVSNNGSRIISKIVESRGGGERVINPAWVNDESRETALATAHIFPLFTVEGEVEAEKAFHNQSAFKVGALIHPIPELTLGALLYATNHEDRFHLLANEEETRQLDLSAEVGEWILSLRRRQVIRLSELEDDRTAIYTRVGVEHPLGQSVLVRAGRETEEEMGDTESEEHSVKTALDFEVTFDKGKFGLGFVLESVPESKKDGLKVLPITTMASIEHAVGALGVATAGISIGNRGEGRTSNVGLRYDFDNAALRLKYEIVSGVDDEREMTTAEVSIKF